MTFCFRCLACGHKFENSSPSPAKPCPVCGTQPVQRDYRAEAAGLTGLMQLKKERESGLDSETAARLFLPEAKDFINSKDPTGQKGLREWADQHAPSSSNKRPQYPPDLEKRSY